MRSRTRGSSSVTQTGSVAMMRGADRPASAAAAAIVGTMCSPIVRGPTHASVVPSVVRPATFSACGPSAATTSGKWPLGSKKVCASQRIVSPANETRPSSRSGTSTDRNSFRWRIGLSKERPSCAIITSWERPMPRVRRSPTAARAVCA